MVRLVSCGETFKLTDLVKDGLDFFGRRVEAKLEEKASEG